MALRREIRLRKEFLMKKQLEVKSASKEERKRKLTDAVEGGKMIPTELVKGERCAGVAVCVAVLLSIIISFLSLIIFLLPYIYVSYIHKQQQPPPPSAKNK